MSPEEKKVVIYLKGKALFQLGLWKKRSEVHSSPSKRMIARGLFHSIKSLSKGGLLALEFETPVDKLDLVRFKDAYGRRSKSYEGREFTKLISSDFIKLKKPKIGEKQEYKFNNVNLSLEVHKNFNNILKNKKDTIFAILGGSVSDKKGKNVLSYGDIVRTVDFQSTIKSF